MIRTDKQQDRNKHLGQSPIETVKARKRLKLSKLCKLCSQSISANCKCEHVELSDNTDFMARLGDGNDDVAAILAVVAIAVSMYANGYLTLALLLQMAFATGRYPQLLSSTFSSLS